MAEQVVDIRRIKREREEQAFIDARAEASARFLRTREHHAPGGLRFFAKQVFITFFGLAVLVTMTNAGNLQPTATPGSTMFSLEQLASKTGSPGNYDRVYHSLEAIGILVGTTTSPQPLIATASSTVQSSILATFNRPNGFGFQVFGGTGGDGNLTISSGTTTINTIKQYNNLTISAGAALVAAGTSTPIVIAVRGTLTLSGRIDADYAGPEMASDMISGLGCVPGGANGISNGTVVVATTTNPVVGGGGGGGGGADGGGSSAANGGSCGGSGGRSASNATAGNGGSPDLNQQFMGRIRQEFWSTGASGGKGNSGGIGGNGGGAIYIEANTFAFNSGAVISVRGQNGASDNSGAVGGGGGGGGGTVWVRARTITANSGVVGVLGGAGGTESSTGFGGGAGGNGMYVIETITNP
ncbi:MAG: hypothetical protein Q7R73_04925 [bacterium]|nr:hypothetical protein [bacterium]